MTKTIAALAVSLLTYSPAVAHSWYDAECCSQKDCRAYRGQIRVISGRFVLADGRSIAVSSIRNSQDGDWHICERTDRSLICVYAPSGT